MYKTGSARLKASEVISSWFDEGGVKLCVIGIFVIVYAITIDKLANWCYMYHEQDRSQNGPLWNTGAHLSYRHRRLVDTDEE